ncbi:MAG: ECF transporter S component [Clostridia bacterium]|nr:ECF transporter S component [Clostridia bacterium]
MKSTTKLITQTAVMIALLIVLQLVTKGFGQFVTGSCVNGILALSVLFFGTASGIIVAVLSPIFAFIFGIGPALLPVVPVICLGNTVLVVLLDLLVRRRYLKQEATGAEVRVGAAGNISAVICAAVCKFAVLFVLVSKLILPVLSVPEKQAAAITAAFSWPQLVTACIGTAVALLIYSRLRKIIK